MNPKKLLKKLRQGSLNNVSFADFIRLARAVGFEESGTGGSHHHLKHPSFSEKLNLQPMGGEAKPYQIRQFLKLLDKYSLQIRE